MTVTAKLLRLYLVDKQLRGLSSRLRASEAYLGEQDKLLSELDAKASTLVTQIRSLEATLKNDEVEVQSMDERAALLRERMNNAQTSKEHSAFLTEISTIKADKAPIEERMLVAMTKLDALRAEAEAIEAQKAERVGVRQVASNERDARAAEIKDRVDELKKQRDVAKEDVPPPALLIYEQRLALNVEYVMAAVEEQDRRNMEYTCTACYTHLPIEQVSVLLKRGDLTKCPTCSAILYIEDHLREDITGSDKKSRKRSAAAPASHDDFG
jgi:predicted  nucleic acid-binding Zn-ribbon protein